MPTCVAIGARMGVSRISAATLSSTMPTASRNRLMMISIISGLVAIDDIVFSTWDEIWSSVM